MCYSTHRDSVPRDFRPGVSLFEQIVYAAKKAMMCGQMRPGDAFPSVRALSKELKINPNTAAQDCRAPDDGGAAGNAAGDRHCGRGAAGFNAHRRTQLLGHEIEQLVVEAKRLGIGLRG